MDDGESFFFSDIIIIKYSNDGVPLWTNRYSSPGFNFDSADSLILDANGDVCFSGYSYFGPKGVTIKYSNAGFGLWTNDSAYNYPDSLLAVDKNENIFMSKTLSNFSTVATIKYSNNGTRLWTNYYSAAGKQFELVAATSDVMGNLFLAGNCYSNNFNFRLGTSDFVVLKISGTGATLWTNYFNGAGNGDDILKGMAMTANGSKMIMVGSSSLSSTNFGVALQYEIWPRIQTSSSGFGFTNQNFGFLVSGLPGIGFSVQVSTNLQSWQSVQTNQIGSGSVYFNDPFSSSFGQRFYRATVWP